MKVHRIIAVAALTLAPLAAVVASEASPAGASTQYGAQVAVPFVGLGRGNDVAVDPGGDVFVADGPHGIVEKTLSGAESTLIAPPGDGEATYANMPWPQFLAVGLGTQQLLTSGCQVPRSPNHDIKADTQVDLINHELLEMVTDPLLNVWIDSAGSEMGDKCQGQYGPIAAEGSNLVLNGHPYLIQETWSNELHRCAI